MGTEATYKSGDKTFRCYLADGSKGAGAPGVLVIPEANGLGENAMHRADALADLGYVALAIDVFGEPVTSTEQAMGFVKTLTEDWQSLRTRCADGLKTLSDHPAVDPDKLAAIGFCFGGQAAIELGRSGANLQAIVGFHSGLNTLRPEDTQNIKASVLVLLGDQDPLVPAEARQQLMASMAKAGIDCQMVLMSGVVHSFTNPAATAFNVPGVAYDARADRRAWAAMQALLTEKLQTN